jgi:hypothetical protein
MEGGNGRAVRKTPGGGFTELVGGKTSIVYKFQRYYNVARPDGVAKWVIQFAIQPMFPKK